MEKAPAAAAAGEASELCPICQLPILVSQLERHAARCVGEEEGCACRFCGARVFYDDAAAHEARCEQTYAASLKDQQLALQHARYEQLSQTDELVNQHQFQTLHLLNRIAKKQSDAAYPALCKRIAKLGLPLSDLQQALEYLRLRAPLLIHVNIQAYIDYFLKVRRGNTRRFAHSFPPFHPTISSRATPVIPVSCWGGLGEKASANEPAPR
jgi:hypothetical protein